LSMGALQVVVVQCLAKVHCATSWDGLVGAAYVPMNAPGCFVVVVNEEPPSSGAQ
jgi:hypothetical protein